MSTDKCRHGIEFSTICDQCDDERLEQRDEHSKTGDPAVGPTRLLADVAARTAHEIMSQIEFGVPTEGVFELMVKNACLEVLVSANEQAHA